MLAGDWPAGHAREATESAEPSRQPAGGTAGPDYGQP